MLTYRYEAPLPPSLPLPAETPFAALERGKNEVVYYTGDEADSVFRIDEGLVKLSIDLPSGRERVLSIAGPGDFIGALRVRQGGYGETSTTLSESVRLGVMDARTAEASLGDALHRATGLQLERLRETLHDSELPVPARLANTFLRLGERFGTVTEAGTVHLTLPLTHDHLAAMVGAARETTTSVLGELRSAGLIIGTRGRYRFGRGPLRAFALESAQA